MLPIDFLLDCSDTTLGDAQLAAMNRAANARKHIRNLIDELVEAEADVRHVAWLREHREDLRELGRTQALQKTLDFRVSPSVERPSALGVAHRAFADAD
ncbi:MAG TPA: hypothetical protein VFB23_11310 [Candidatus Acidoferrales bacterium]|nr:hypothetical protein [Candidatus Acidoferrales bacterium]